MKKIIIPLFAFALLLSQYSCVEKVAGSLLENKPPKTFVSLFPDTGISRQQSNLHMHWWGDDADGLVVGYFFTWNNVQWTFTAKNDSIIAFPLAGGDTVYTFRVAAVDNSGNGKYDASLTAGGMLFGPEPFTDINNNGKWDEGEPYIDCGSIDPNPASLKLPIKNTPPKIDYFRDGRGQAIEVPDSTYSVATFSWSVSDVDGDNSITGIYISLNDTTNMVELPSTTRLLTIVAKPPFAGNTVSCDLFLGGTLTPTTVKLPGLKLNSQNKLYIKAKDIASASSANLVFPSSGDKWYVRKPSGKLLVIDDFLPNDKSSRTFRQVFDSLGLSAGSVDFWDIKAGSISGSPGTLMPKYLNTMFLETMKLYKAVFWYTDNQPSQEAARLCVKQYASAQAGGKILLTMMFPSTLDVTALGDILPLDTLRASLVNDGFFTYGTKVFPQQAGYPQLVTDEDDSNPINLIREYFPDNISSVPLYKLDFPGQPTVGFKSTDSRIVFIGLPLAYCNGAPNYNLKALFQKVFLQDFGVTP